MKRWTFTGTKQNRRRKHLRKLSSQIPGSKIWGLTGGVASGKSQVARYFSELGVGVIDADQISRGLISPGGKAHAAVVERFGTDDRKIIREKIFADPQARQDLEKLLHPLIQMESAKKILEWVFDRATDESDAERVPVIYEAALLMETGRFTAFDGVILVEAPVEQRVQRLITRDGVDDTLARHMIAAQLRDDQRRSAAQSVGVRAEVIDNSGDLAALKSQVENLALRLGLIRKQDLP